MGVAAALGASACGGSDEIPPTITTNVGAATPSTATTSSTAGTGSVPSAPATGSTAASTAAPPPPSATTRGESQPGGGGDEQGTRVPATFRLRGGKLQPNRVSVPAFLAAEVTVASTDARPHAVQVKVGKGYSLQVPPHGTASTRVPGQKGGRFAVLVDGRAAGSLVWGGEPGP